MAYQSIDPYTETLVKTFDEHTDAQMDAILDAAHATYRDD